MVPAVVALACAGGATRLEMAAAARSPSASWAYLGDAMREASSLVDGYAADDLERREGHRLLARTLALGFDRFLEYGRGGVPEFYRLQSAHRKFAGDNPDQLYHGAAVDGRSRYRVGGRWSDGETTTRLIELSVYGGGLRFDDENASRRLIGHLDETGLVREPDGSFEVVLSAEPHDGNWIPLDDEAEMLLVRRYFDTPQVADPLPLSIEREGGSPAPAPLSQAELARGLIGTARFLVETMKVWGGWYPDVRERAGPNVLVPLEDGGDLLTPAGMTYMEGAWELGEGEALLVRFVPPDVPYWGFLPMNVWMESLDWRVVPASINGASAVRDAADGSVTIVVAEQDPGVPNWLGTQGHRRGLMSFRFARLGEQPLPVVSTEVVAVSQVARRLGR